MKLFLLLTYLAIGIAGYYFYNFYQESNQSAAQSAATIADLNQRLTDTTAQIDALKADSARLAATLETEKKANASLMAALPTATQPSQTSSGQTSLAPPATKPWKAPNPVPAQANWTWTLTNGTSYKNVVIKKVEPDCVTILDDDGGASVNISDLSPDIQKMLNYDPDIAKTVAAVRAKDDLEDSALLAAERQRMSDELKKQGATDQKVDNSAQAEADRQVMEQQILDLQEDIRRKQREITRNSETEGNNYSGGNSYTTTIGGGGTSHEGFEEAIDNDKQQIAALQSKLGIPSTGTATYTADPVTTP